MQWRFCPLEARTYKARIHVNYVLPDSSNSNKGDKVTKFTVVARGYDLREEDHHRWGSEGLSLSLSCSAFFSSTLPKHLILGSWIQESPTFDQRGTEGTSFPDGSAS